jgi:hypothetical protein
VTLTAPQKATVKAAILSDNTLNALPNNSDGNYAIALALNAAASPAYWVWRTNISRSEIYNTTSDTGSTWSWTLYKGQAAVEQNAWVQMFMGDQANISQVNLRVGIAAIFTAGASAQRDHCLAVGRRTCNRIEKMLAAAVTSPPANTGNDGVVGNRGKTTNPDVLTFEGNITGDDIEAARNS